MIDNELQHHGVKGQRWGVRRYQNKDGSLTALGERRIAKLDARKTAETLKNKRYKAKNTKDTNQNEVAEAQNNASRGRTISKKTLVKVGAVTLASGILLTQTKTGRALCFVAMGAGHVGALAVKAVARSLG